MLNNGFWRECRGLKDIALLCLAQQAADTTRHLLWYICRTSRRGYSTWDRFQGREVSTRLTGNFCFSSGKVFFSSAPGVLRIQLPAASQLRLHPGAVALPTVLRRNEATRLF